MASIRERNGKFQIEVSCGTDIYGKRLKESTTFDPGPGLSARKRREAAQAFAHEFEERIKRGFAMDGRKVTLKEFSDRWLSEYAPQNLEARTLQDYRRELEDRILPGLGHYKLFDLRPHILNAFFSGMTKDGARKDGKAGGYSKGTITKTRNVLSSVLTTAAQWEIIESNPLQKVRYKASNTPEKLKFFTPEQAATFLTYMEKPYTVTTKGHKRVDDTGKEYTVGDYKRACELPEQMKILFYLAVYAGLRKGELLALTFQDFDIEHDTVSITKAVSVVGGQQITKQPKTRTSCRLVTIPHFLSLRVRALQVERTKYRLALGPEWQGADWLFIQDNGKQMCYSTPYSAFTDTVSRYNRGKPAAKQLPVIPFHGLRHTSATLLIANNQDVRTVSRRLGHAQASTTLNIYAHSFQELDKKAADTLEMALRKKA